MELGADDYLTKPFDDNELLNAIETSFRKNDLRSREYEHGVKGLDSFLKDAEKALNLKDLCKDRKARLIKKEMCYLLRRRLAAVCLLYSVR